MSKAQFDNQRQDALLVRLKQCVGQIKNNNKDNNTRPSTSHRQPYRPTPTSNRLQPQPQSHHSNPRNPISTHLTQPPQNKQNQPSSQLKLRKAYLCDQPLNERINMTDRKALYCGFNQKQQLESYQRKRFVHQGRISFNQVTQSTKKRINQRESLFCDGLDRMTPKKIVQCRQQRKQKFDPTQESLLLQRLHMRSRKRALDKEQATINKDQFTTNKQKSFSIQRDPETSTIKHYPSISAQPANTEQNTYQQTQQKQIPHHQTQQHYMPQPQAYPSHPSIAHREDRQIRQTGDRSDFQYKKSGVEFRRSDVEHKRSDKLEKLNRISQMNEQINDRIRRIVSTFEGYLEHKR